MADAWHVEALLLDCTYYHSEDLSGSVATVPSAGCSTAGLQIEHSQLSKPAMPDWPMVKWWV